MHKRLSKKEGRFMRRLFSMMLLVAGASLIVVSAALATGAPKLKGEMVAHRIVLNEKNEEVALSADKVYPNDTIEYELSYRNVGDMPAGGVSLIGVIPERTVYIDDSATHSPSLDVMFSIDGGKSFHRPPVKYTVVKADGEEEQRVATPDMYTNIKWLMNTELGVGKEIVVHYRVRVR